MTKSNGIVIRTNWRTPSVVAPNMARLRAAECVDCGNKIPRCSQRCPLCSKKRRNRIQNHRKVMKRNHREGFYG